MSRETQVWPKVLQTTHGLSHTSPSLWSVTHRCDMFCCWTVGKLYRDYWPCHTISQPMSSTGQTGVSCFAAEPSVMSGLSDYFSSDMFQWQCWTIFQVTSYYKLVIRISSVMLCRWTVSYIRTSKLLLNWEVPVLVAMSDYFPGHKLSYCDLHKNKKL